MQISNDWYLIVDVEATCSDDGAVPRHEMEIIEIGAVMQSSRTFEIESEFQTFIRPVRHPVLTRFCTELTGITQHDVADAPSFRQAIGGDETVDGRVRRRDVFCSWGESYDPEPVPAGLRVSQVRLPVSRSGHLNLKAEFSPPRTAEEIRARPGRAASWHRLRGNTSPRHRRRPATSRRVVRRVCVGA